MRMACGPGHPVSPHVESKTGVLPTPCNADNQTNQRIIQAILRKHLETPVALAANGLEGIEAVQRERFDCVLMDMQVRLVEDRLVDPPLTLPADVLVLVRCVSSVQMPLCDGLDATRRIRALEAAGAVQSVRIIGVTANGAALAWRRPPEKIVLSCLATRRGRAQPALLY